ncbi:hypothetical protein DFS33DRAFT_1268313, partial [Desarmillaria ectypa]
RTPIPSDHPSCPDTDNTKEFCRYILEQASLNHSTAKKAVRFFGAFHLSRCIHMHIGSSSRWLSLSHQNRHI